MPSAKTLKEKREKMQEDFSPLIAEAIPKQIELAQSGKLNEAIENLLSIEKQTRLGEDHLSTSKLAITIVRLCFEAKQWDLLNQNLHILSKRRGQLRTVVQDFVKEAMTFLDKIPEKQIQLELLNTLRVITEGKIYVEIERARLTRILAKIKEDENKIGEAADILQEIQVETFGQMDKYEKTDFILEQMRLCLEKKDFIKAQILSNKITRKALNANDFQDLKIRFYTQMIRYYEHELKYLEICRCYMSIYDTPKIKENDTEWKKYLQLIVIYICLSPFDNEQSDLMNRINEDKNLVQIPIYRQLLKLFLTQELMRWPQFEQLYQTELNQHCTIFYIDAEGKNIYWSELRKRVVEHNIRVIATYYQRITTRRLSQLLDLPADEVETFISDLVVNKSIFAKIDRPKGIVGFRKHKEPNELLNEWSRNITDLLGLLEGTTHLIHRELMVHKVE